MIKSEIAINMMGRIISTPRNEVVENLRNLTRRSIDIDLDSELHFDA